MSTVNIEGISLLIKLLLIRVILMFKKIHKADIPKLQFTFQILL